MRAKTVFRSGCFRTVLLRRCALWAVDWNGLATFGCSTGTTTAGTAVRPWEGNATVNNWGVPAGPPSPRPPTTSLLELFRRGHYHNITIGGLTLGSGATMEIYGNNTFTLAGSLIRTV